MLRIRYVRAARKALESLPAKHKRQLFAKIESLRSDSNPPDSARLKGAGRDYSRADSGEYRIIYRVEADELLIAAVGSRNDDRIYRAFERSQKP
jgi:mRNA interferase RelE/StbE